MPLPLFIKDLEGKVVISLPEIDGFERHRDNFLPDAVIVADREFTFGELPVPTYPAQEVLNGYHCADLGYCGLSGHAHSA